VTLVGLITKHGILIVEFANQIQAKGKGVLEAVEEAAVLRLRPILMTTGAMVLGAVPLAVAHGAGAESRQQIGWVIVGGMLLGTLSRSLWCPRRIHCLHEGTRRSKIGCRKTGKPWVAMARRPTNSREKRGER
jgi:multidrug efflux pump